VPIPVDVKNSSEAGLGEYADFAGERVKGRELIRASTSTTTSVNELPLPLTTCIAEDCVSGSLFAVPSLQINENDGASSAFYALLYRRARCASFVCLFAVLMAV
jgi:hypothetical protein